MTLQVVGYQGEEVAIRGSRKYMIGIHLRIATSSLLLLTLHVIPSVSEESLGYKAKLIMKRE